MLWLKECPKCENGDLVMDRDLYGFYRSCVQCGYYEELPSDRVLTLAPVLSTVKRPILTASRKGRRRVMEVA